MYILIYVFQLQKIIKKMFVKKQQQKKRNKQSLDL
jgi:hypothetical protein